MALTYPAITVSLLLFKKLDISKVYWFFPLINASFGGMLTILLIMKIAGT